MCLHYRPNSDWYAFLRLSGSADPHPPQTQPPSGLKERESFQVHTEWEGCWAHPQFTPRHGPKGSHQSWCRWLWGLQLIKSYTYWCKNMHHLWLEILSFYSIHTVWLFPKGTRITVEFQGHGEMLITSASTHHPHLLNITWWFLWNLEDGNPVGLLSFKSVGSIAKRIQPVCLKHVFQLPKSRQLCFLSLTEEWLCSMPYSFK